MDDGKRRTHWDEVYGRVEPAGLSWYQPDPRQSLDLIATIGVPTTAGIIDVGGGASSLAGELVHRGFDDVTVLDVSRRALDEARARLGESGAKVEWLVADLLSWQPSRRYDLWHDRAVFHFLVDDHDRDAYLAALDGALVEGGHLIVATFALDGPEQCSGLPTRRYDEASLAAAFGDGYELVDGRREEHHTPWEAIQPFTWVVLRRTS